MLPTAAHDSGDEHDTPPDSQPSSFSSFGVDCTTHSVPFQCSARVTNLLALLNDTPTAVHEVLDTHDTPSNELYFVPLGPDTDCSVHSVPFHRAAKGTPFTAAVS